MCKQALQYGDRKGRQVEGREGDTEEARQELKQKGKQRGRQWNQASWQESREDQEQMITMQAEAWSLSSREVLQKVRISRTKTRCQIHQSS